MERTPTPSVKQPVVLESLKPPHEHFQLGNQSSQRVSNKNIVMWYQFKYGYVVRAPVWVWDPWFMFAVNLLFVQSMIHTNMFVGTSVYVSANNDKQNMASLVQLLLPNLLCFSAKSLSSISHMLNISNFRILTLINSRTLEALKTSWWNKDKQNCPTLADESDGISIHNIGGVFLVIVIGSGLSLITLAFECYWYRWVVYANIV